MQIDHLRIVRWRERADEYRVCADACVAVGAQLAYRALAECADRVADRLEQAGAGEPNAGASEASARPAVEARKRTSRGT
jgi:hypothetical protein